MGNKTCGPHVPTAPRTAWELKVGPETATSDPVRDQGQSRPSAAQTWSANAAAAPPVAVPPHDEPSSPPDLVGLGLAGAVGAAALELAEGLVGIGGVAADVSQSVEPSLASTDGCGLGGERDGDGEEGGSGGGELHVGISTWFSLCCWQASCRNHVHPMLAAQKPPHVGLRWWLGCVGGRWCDK